MKWLAELFLNPFLITCLSSWGWAQFFKVLIFAVIHKQIDWKRLLGDGGMPSGHAATVTSLAVYTGFFYGLTSFEFAMAFVFAIVVCRDAMGVRNETGKQTLLIKQLVHAYEVLTAENLPEVKLKEFVGHTPFQVMIGALIGIVNAMLIHYCWN